MCQRERSLRRGKGKPAPTVRFFHLAPSRTAFRVRTWPVSRSSESVVADSAAANRLAKLIVEAREASDKEVGKAARQMARATQAIISLAKEANFQSRALKGKIENLFFREDGFYLAKSPLDKVKENKLIPRMSLLFEITLIRCRPLPRPLTHFGVAEDGKERPAPPPAPSVTSPRDQKTRQKVHAKLRVNLPKIRFLPPRLVAQILLCPGVIDAGPGQQESREESQTPSPGGPLRKCSSRAINCPKAASVQAEEQRPVLRVRPRRIAPDNLHN